MVMVFGFFAKTFDTTTAMIIRHGYNGRISPMHTETFIHIQRTAVQ